MTTKEQTSISLEKLLEGIPCQLSPGTSASTEIHRVCSDSRSVQPGSLFVAVKGDTRDGHDFVSSAVSAGAVAVVVDSGKGFRAAADELKDIVVISVADTRETLGVVASRFYGNPADNLMMIGITGTNGKTTVSYLMEHVMSAAGLRVGVIGTVNYRYCSRDGTPVTYPAGFTTPDPVTLCGMLKEMSEAGITHVLMEVSSHALRQKRIGPITFGLAVYTNLSQDHLDYHRDMEDYFAAKCLLFREKMIPGGRVVICEPESLSVQKKSWADRLCLLCAELDLVAIRCGRSGEMEFTCANLQMNKSGISFDCVEAGGQMYTIHSPLIGNFNSENLLVSVAALRELGLDPAAVSEHLAQAYGAPGRMQRVCLPARSRQMPVVLVDYAHTPDALENVLATVKALPHRTLFCVFGCGGNRDRGKRPLMGEIVARFADVAIITDDNPRNEHPAGIREDIIASEAIGRDRVKDLEWLGRRREGERGCLEIGGRSRAIAAAVHHGGPEDIVLIAGKGHETYQITETGKSFFDDCLCAQEHSLDWDVELVAEATGGSITAPGSGQPFRQVSTDSRSVGRGDIFVALCGELFNGHDFIEKSVERGAACLVVSGNRVVSGGAAACVKVDDTLRALGDLAGWRRQALKLINNPVVVGITGSCGKTTVKEMTASIFSRNWPEQADQPPNRVLKTAGNFNNRIGLPLSLLPASVGQKAIILEMGMNRPGEIDCLTRIADPDIACITNIHKAHLEGLGSIENVARAKAELFSGSRNSCVQVINLDDQRIAALGRAYPDHRQVSYAVSESGIARGPDVWATDLTSDHRGHMSFVLHVGAEKGSVRLRSPGLHNYANSCAAAAIAHAAEIDFESIVEGLEDFISSANRMESVRTPKGLNILNDTYNANPASMASALDTIKTFQALTRVAILGDMLELGEEAERLHEDIGRCVAASAIDYLGVCGTLSRHVAEAAAMSGMSEDRIVIFDEKQRVVDWVAGLLHTGQLHPDDWILVKASRGLALDTIVDQLIRTC